MKCWGKCSVKEKVAEGRIKLAFENESKQCDREVSIYSPEIAMPST